MQAIKTVKPATLYQWLHDGEAVLVDVREKAEYREGHIKGSINLPLSEVSVDHEHMPRHPDKKIVFQCRSGKRSQLACEKLLKGGVEHDVWNLEGGFDSWYKMELPTVFIKTNVISIERQQHLIAATFVLMSLFLGIYVHPAFFVIQLLMAAGWFTSGFFGWCGVRLLLSKMPWNR
jgi:rhodanese-related sulfurtransferase